MIDPQLLQQLLAMRQQQGGGGMEMGMHGPPHGNPGVNPYIMMLMRNGGMPQMSQRPMGGMGMPMQSDWPQQQQMGRPAPQATAPSGPQGAQGIPAPQGRMGQQGGGYGQQQRPQQARQGGQGGGQQNPYQSMFSQVGQGGSYGQQQGQQGNMQRTPTGLPRLQQMGMPSGQVGQGSGRPY